MASIPEMGAGWDQEPAFPAPGQKPALASSSVPAASPWRTWIKARSLTRPTWTVFLISTVSVGLGVWWAMHERAVQSAVAPAVAVYLAQAQQALIDRHYIEPADASAVHYYQLVLAVDPDNHTARDGIDRIADRVLADAEAIIPREKLADAVVAIEAIRRVRPAHPQLPRVEALLRQEQERLVSLARQEMDAAASNPPGNRSAERSSNTAAPLTAPTLHALTLARQRMSEGALLVPANDSAKFHALTARRLAPDDPQVRAALSDVRTRLAANAEQAIANERFDLATPLIDGARELGLSAREVKKLQTKLQAAQQGGRKEQLLQLVLQQTQANHLMEPAHDSATDYLQQLARLDRRSQAFQRALDALGTRLVANARTAIYQENYEYAAKLLAHARSLGFNSAELESADNTARTALQNPKQPLTAAQLRRRIKYVEPEYPDAAKRTHAAGWVDVTIFIAPNGAVTDARVANASVPQVFDHAALAAVRKWRYEPRPSSGRKDLDRLDLRLEFHE